MSLPNENWLNEYEGQRENSAIDGFRSGAFDWLVDSIRQDLTELNKGWIDCPKCGRCNRECDNCSYCGTKPNEKA